MSETKRPQEVEMYSGGGLRRSVYLKDEADAYIAALERRARLMERALDYAVADLAERGVNHAPTKIKELLLQVATLIIDDELAKEQADV